MAEAARFRANAVQHKPAASVAGTGGGVKWVRVSDYCIQSGGYTVTKNHTQAGWLYAAIADKAVIGTYATAAEAQAALEGKRK